MMIDILVKQNGLARPCDLRPDSHLIFERQKKRTILSILIFPDRLLGKTISSHLYQQPKDINIITGGDNQVDMLVMKPR